MSEEKACWFVASIRNCQFQKIGRTLTELGVEHYIPDTFRTLLFVRAAKSRALSLANSGVLSAKYLIDRATHTLLQVPEKQMQDFIHVMNTAPDAECLSQIPFEVGGRVRVIKGSLKGVEGDIVELSGRSHLTVSVSSLLCARVAMPRDYVTAIDANVGK